MYKKSLVQNKNIFYKRILKYYSLNKMKIDYYSKTDEVAEKIRKKANLIYVLLPIGYDLETVEYALNCEVDFKGKEGETTIFMVNDKHVFLGGLGYKQHIYQLKNKKINESVYKYDGVYG